MVNIGPKLSDALDQVGISNLAELQRLGAEAAWDRLREAGLYHCVNSLLALHGAVAGVRWHQLPDEIKAAAATHVREVDQASPAGSKQA